MAAEFYAFAKGIVTNFVSSWCTTIRSPNRHRVFLVNYWTMYFSLHQTEIGVAQSQKRRSHCRWTARVLFSLKAQKITTCLVQTTHHLKLGRDWSQVHIAPPRHTDSPYAQSLKPATTRFIGKLPILHFVTVLYSTTEPQCYVALHRFYYSVAWINDNMQPVS
jgi:hypothetical protein